MLSFGEYKPYANNRDNSSVIFTAVYRWLMACSKDRVYWRVTVGVFFVCLFVCLFLKGKFR